MSYIEDISISDKTLNEIKTVIGYPTITEEFSFIMTDDQIKQFAIAPALETYFTHFPQLFQVQINTTGANDVASQQCPDNTLGIMRQQFIPQSSTIGGANLMQQGMFYQNPFYSASQVISKGSYGSGGNFGTPFGYGSELNVYQNRFYNESLESSNKAYMIRYNEDTNMLETKSSIPGAFYIELGVWSNDCETIPIRKRKSFIEYAQSRLLLRFANILKLSESDLPVSIDSQYLLDEAEKLEEKSLTYFRESSFMPVMR